MVKNVVIIALAVMLVGCKATDQEMNDSDSQISNSKLPIIKPNCSAPPPIENIWVLEPMLTEKGLIKEGMSQEKKESVIRSYIHKKNQQYSRCLKGKD